MALKAPAHLVTKLEREGRGAFVCVEGLATLDGQANGSHISVAANRLEAAYSISLLDFGGRSSARTKDL